MANYAFPKYEITEKSGEENVNLTTQNSRF